MDTIEHYDDFDRLEKALEASHNIEESQSKGTQESPESEREKGKTDKMPNTRKNKQSQKTCDIDSNGVASFSICLSQREHTLLKIMSTFTGKSMSSLVREGLSDYFDKIEEVLSNNSGVGIDLLKNAFKNI